MGAVGVLTVSARCSCLNHLQLAVKAIFNIVCVNVKMLKVIQTEICCCTTYFYNVFNKIN